jgi:hypothetical protein
MLKLWLKELQFGVIAKMKDETDLRGKYYSVLDLHYD